MELLFLVLLGFAAKSSWDHVRTTRKASESARLKEFAKTFRKGEIPKRKLKGAANRHALGWWLSEAGHGFPVARRGWQAGWIAHKTEAERHRARLEEAKTTHADVQTSLLPELLDHKARQAAARKRRDEILERLKGQPEEAKGSRKAVQEAADEVAAKRAEKQAGAVPPMPSGAVDQKAAPGPYALPTRHAGMRDSDWLRPGQPGCEACGGTGAGPDGEGICPSCHGWGSGPDDPNAPELPEGTICNACGRPGTADDPVLDQPGGSHVHRSHAEADPRNGDPGDPRSPAYVEPPDETALYEDAPSPTGGSPVSTVEATFHSVIAGARAAVARSDQDSAQIRASKEAAYQLADQMAAAGVDPAAIEAQMNHADALAKAAAALAEAGEHAQSTAATTEKFHGGMQEAHDSAPGKVADREFHESQ